MSAPRSRHICSIVPPHLLKAIAESSENNEEKRDAAIRTLDHCQLVRNKRVEVLQSLTQPRGYHSHGHHASGTHRQSIVPDHLLKAIVDSPDTDQDTKSRATRDLEHIQGIHASYIAAQGAAEQKQQQQTLTASSSKTTPTSMYRAVYDAKHTENESSLPGTQLRIEGQPAVKDQMANDAFDNAGKVIQFYQKFFNWNSIDNRGMHVISSVHFSNKYENAFWDPEKMQMVYGDGGSFLYNFCKCIDVIAHEMTHAVTEHTSPLDYQDQAGALNEHISDVFGIMCKQWVEQETADTADWLIGEGCLMPGVKGVALRSMKAPGTAYNDRRFGKDPQPDNMSDYEATEDDNGGVHIYSGIPNRAFYLFSVAMGGFSYDQAGQVWWKTMNAGRIPAKCTFSQFANVTIEIAKETYGDDAAQKCSDAWNQVGVRTSAV